MAPQKREKALREAMETRDQERLSIYKDRMGNLLVIISIIYIPIYIFLNYLVTHGNLTEESVSTARPWHLLKAERKKKIRKDCYTAATHIAQHFVTKFLCFLSFYYLYIANF